jgi:hypothetical protein
MQSQVERKQKDEQARATVNHLLEETGERERYVCACVHHSGSSLIQ